MKKAISILAALVAVTAVFASIPAYQTGQYYVWSDATVASNALQYINVDSGWFPRVEANGYRADCWCKKVEYRMDGKACFPRIPSKLLVHYNVSSNQQALFFSTYNPTIESYATNWFPEVE